MSLWINFLASNKVTTKLGLGFYAWRDGLSPKSRFAYEVTIFALAVVAITVLVLIVYLISGGEF